MHALQDRQGPARRVFHPHGHLPGTLQFCMVQRCNFALLHVAWLQHCVAQPEEVIGNRDGVLACEPPAPPPQERQALPVGTYTDSCDGCVLETEGGGSILRCEQCKSNNGMHRASVLAVRSCGDDEVIGNRDGALLCERRQGASASPSEGSMLSGGEGKSERKGPGAAHSPDSVPRAEL